MAYKWNADRLQDRDVQDVSPNDGDVLKWNNSESRWEPQEDTSGVTDHGALTGLGDDDHTQYLLHDGTRAMSGDLDLGSNAITNVGNVDGRDVSADGSTLDTHVANTSNPHSVTASQVGNDTAQWNADRLQGNDVQDVLPGDGDVLKWSDANTRWEPAADAGEANTADNVGLGGVGVFKTKSGSELQFKNINAGSGKITIFDDTTNDEVDIDVDESALDHGSISGLGDDDHTQYLLHDGTRAMSGDLDMGTNNITDVGNVDGRDVSADGSTLDTHVAGGLSEHGISSASDLNTDLGSDLLEWGVGRIHADLTPETVTISTTQTWVTVDVSTASDLLRNVVSASDGTIAPDTGVSGVWRIEASLNIHADGIDQEVRARIAVNGTGVTDTERRVPVPGNASGDIYASLSLSDVASLSDSDAVTVEVANWTGTENITLVGFDLSMYKLANS